MLWILQTMIFGKPSYNYAYMHTYTFPLYNNNNTQQQQQQQQQWQQQQRDNNIYMFTSCIYMFTWMSLCFDLLLDLSRSLHKSFTCPTVFFEDPSIPWTGQSQHFHEILFHLISLLSSKKLNHLLKIFIHSFIRSFREKIVSCFLFSYYDFKSMINIITIFMFSLIYLEQKWIRGKSPWCKGFLDLCFEVSEFELQSYCYVNFQTNTHYSPTYGLNSVTTVLVHG